MQLRTRGGRRVRCPPARARARAAAGGGGPRAAAGPRSERALQATVLSPSIFAGAAGLYADAAWAARGPPLLHPRLLPRK
jgi:hypothetical protein